MNETQSGLLFTFLMWSGSATKTVSPFPGIPVNLTSGPYWPCSCLSRTYASWERFPGTQIHCQKKIQNYENLDLDF